MYTTTRTEIQYVTLVVIVTELCMSDMTISLFVHIYKRVYMYLITYGHFVNITIQLQMTAPMIH